MYGVNDNYRRAMLDDNRNFSAAISITLSDGTKLEFDNSNIMYGGITFTASSSDEGAFSIGNTVCEECEIKLNNIDDSLSGYSFKRALFYVSMILVVDDETVGTIKKGPFTVSKSESDDQTITLTAYDNMMKFEKKYTESSINYPATLSQIIANACRSCGVSEQNYNMPDIYLDKEYLVPCPNKPMDLDTTYRDIIGWVAQILGGYARINSGGYLQFCWYNDVFSNNVDGGDFTDYKSGDYVDGGGFEAYTEDTNFDGGGFNSGEANMNSYHNVFSLSSQTIATEDISISNVKVAAHAPNSVEGYYSNGMFYHDADHTATMIGVLNVLYVDKDTNKTYRWNTESYVPYTYDSYKANVDNGYCVTIEDNPLIYLEQSRRVMLWIAEKLVGLTFRPLEIEALSDPTIEAGDPAYVTDRKGNEFKTFFTTASYSINNYEKLSCTNLENEESE